MAMAMEEDEAKGKQTKYKRVFLGFGDDLAVDDNSYGSGAVCRKSASQTPIEGSRKEIAYWFVDDARTHPSRRIPGGIGQTASRDTNPQVVVVAGIFVHKKVGNGSADGSGAHGNRGRVGGAGGKKVCQGASRNSLLNGFDVVGIRSRKQGRQRDVDVAGFVGVEKVAGEFPRVLS